MTRKADTETLCEGHRACHQMW